MVDLKGTYMTLAQAAYITPPIQGALFDFSTRRLSDLRQ
jgi:hypothetical protein